MSNEQWGTDLRLLRNLTYQSDVERGHDLLVTTRPETGGIDLARAQGEENLRQALLLRFLTPAGELAILGHPEYGSRLFELLGEPNTPTNRNRAKIYVLQALAQEPRVAEVLRVEVTPGRLDRSQIDIAISVRAIDAQAPLNLVFPFSLEGG